MLLRTALTTAAVLLGLALAGCSSTDDTAATTGMDMGSSSSAPTPSAQAGVVFNDADVTFLTDMTPHHAQALEMATMVEGRSTNQAVIDLATQIAGEQQPELDTMSALLTSFGKPVPATDGGMDMGSTSGMSGMMSADDMTRLGTLSGTEFDRTWLTMMTEHHTGAVEMSATELADGSNADAKDLATSITSAQQAEITTMQGLLAQL